MDLDVVSEDIELENDTELVIAINVACKVSESLFTDCVDIAVFELEADSSTKNSA